MFALLSNLYISLHYVRLKSMLPYVQSEDARKATVCVQGGGDAWRYIFK